MKQDEIDPNFPAAHFQDGRDLYSASVAKVGKSRMGWVGEEQPLDDIETPAFAWTRLALVLAWMAVAVWFFWGAAQAVWPVLVYALGTV